MAILKNGLLGGFSGAIGPLSGYVLNGQHIIRSRVGPNKRPPTPKQLASRQTMVIVNRFLKVCTPFVKEGFAGAATTNIRVPAYSQAVSYLTKYALEGEYPNLRLDYSKVRLSTGPLPVQDVNADVQLVARQLIFSWAANSKHRNDHVMLLAYCPECNEAVYELCGAKRSTGYEVLPLPERWMGRQAETWLSFKAENKSLCMDSIYTGSVQL
jgi:hypothetical protein